MPGRLIDDAPRAWWSVGLPGIRPAPSGFSTYTRCAYENLPTVDAGALEDLAWLRGLPSRTPSIVAGAEGDPTPVRPVDAAGLAALGVSVPASFARLAAEPHLAGAVRSPTSCYLDLADAAVPVEDAEGGVLVHVLSDQQWVRHWLLYADDRGNEAVVTTSEPLGFRVEEGDPAPTLDDLEVCALSFAEFLYRIWIEGELYWLGAAGVPLEEPFASYAGRLGEAPGLS